MFEKCTFETKICDCAQTFVNGWFPNEQTGNSKKKEKKEKSLLEIKDSLQSLTIV